MIRFRLTELIAEKAFRERRVVQWTHLDLAPAQPRQLDVSTHDAGQLGPCPGERVPFGLADQQLGMGDLTQSADMVAMQV